MASEWRRADAVLTGPVRVGRIDTYTGSGVHASMTDTTDPREGGSEYAELLEDFDLKANGIYRFYRDDAFRAAAAIRALEAKAAAAEAALQELLARIHRDGGHYAAEHGLEKATEDADAIVAEVFADRDHWKRSFDRMAGDAFAEKRRNESLSADRDRLAGEVEFMKRAVAMADRNRVGLLHELAAARENEARYLWLRSSDQEQVEVFAHYTLDALDAAIDAARRAGEGEK